MREEIGAKANVEERGRFTDYLKTVRMQRVRTCENRGEADEESRRDWDSLSSPL